MDWSWRNSFLDDRRHTLMTLLLMANHYKIIWLVAVLVQRQKVSILRLSLKIYVP